MRSTANRPVAQRGLAFAMNHVVRHAMVGVALVLAGCTGQRTDVHARDVVPVVLTPHGDPGLRDLRARYRAAVCARLAATDPKCDDVLLRLGGEADTPAPLETAAPMEPTDFSRRYRVALIPGFLSQCFDGLARPFADVERALLDAHVDVDYLRLPGRGSTLINSGEISNYVQTLHEDPRSLVVVAYSKGLLDVLEFTVRYPDLASRIAAIISVAGAAYGSPLADELLTIYKDWAAKFPLPACAPGNGDELEDLRRNTRLEWWRMHRDAFKVPVFTLVATPRPEHVSPATRATYAHLARIDARNDGKLLWYDQLVPGGYLLGYANADHWTVAIPVAQELPALAFLFRDDVPRAALIHGALAVAAETLASNRHE